jgi:hypothetical protein
VVRAARRANLDVRIATSGNCPFVDLSVLRERRHREMDACRRFYARSLKALVRSRPNLVVMAARTDEYLRSASFGLANRGADTHSNQTGAKERLWYQGLKSTLDHLNDRGIPVVVVHPVPELPTSVADCAVVRILTRSCTGSTARATDDERRQIAVDIEDNATTAAPDAWTIDLQNRLCDADRCEGMRGDTILYRDSSHLSVDATPRLTGAFYRAIVDYARPPAP